MRNLLAALLLTSTIASADDRPNIVFLLTDDQTTYSLGCYGNPDVKTPNMDALAAEGMAFDEHYNTTAICMASRASIMTGMFEYKTGCNFDHGDLLEEHWKKSYPILLRKAGYTTAIAGKIGFEVTKTAGKKGELPSEDFDRWGAGPKQTYYETAKNKSMAAYAEKYPHSTRAYGAFGADFIRDSAKSEKPFCLSISFKAPHMPATPDKLDNDVYKGKIFTKPGNYGREYGEHFSEQSRQGRQFERFNSWHYSDKYDKVMATYNQQIYAVDVAIGMIREAIKEAGIEKDTVIIFTSDNGFLCGSHGYGSKVLPYEESARAPLMILDPRQPNSGKKLRSQSLTGNIDIAPTILDLAGIERPANMDGHSLLPLYANPATEIHTSLPLINVWGPKTVHSLAVVTKELKYIYWPGHGDKLKPAEELYDTKNDPLELTNAIKTNKDADAMREVYDTHLEHWAKHAVSYHNYQPFAKIFERKE